MKLKGKLISNFMFNLLIFFVFSINLKAKAIELIPKEASFLKIVEMSSANFSGAEQIWKGFSLRQPPMVVNIEDERIIIFSDNCPKDSAKIKFLSNYYCIKKVNKSDLERSFSWDYLIDGKPAFFCKFKENILDTFRFCVHEKFHQFQHSVFKNTNKKKTKPNSEPIEYIEDFYLAKALLETDGKWKDYIRIFIALRELRYKNSSKDKIFYEEDKELVEGTARYVDLKVVEWDKKAEIKFPHRYLSAFLFSSYGSFSSELDNVIDEVYYNRGAAICMLMDKLKINWQKEVEAGNSPFSILKRNVVISKTDYIEAEKIIRKTRDFTKPLIRKSKENEEKIINEVKNYNGIKLILKGGVYSEYSRVGGKEISSEIGNIIWQASDYTLISNKIELTTYNTPVIVGKDFEITVFSGQEIDKIKILSGDNEISKNDIYSWKKVSNLTITSPYFSFKLKTGSANVKLEGKNIIIDLAYKK